VANRTQLDHQSDAHPSLSAVEMMQSKQRDEGMLGTETVRRRAGEPTSKLAADSTLSPKVNCSYTSDVVVYVELLNVS